MDVSQENPARKALAAMALLLAWCPHTPAWISFKISCPFEE
jgi:hypothetical protein